MVEYIGMKRKKNFPKLKLFEALMSFKVANGSKA